MRKTTKRYRISYLFLTALLFTNLASIPVEVSAKDQQATLNLRYPVLFVTQVPIAETFGTVTSTFGNHQSRTDASGRGGDLYIRYPDGTLKNLTAAAGYGGSGYVTGNQAIGVREPNIHWDGNKAVFSMIIGAPTQRYHAQTYHWQLYEISGLGKNDTPIITNVPNQPQNFNNVSPIYGTDDRIIFTSDQPRSGSLLHYPQLDEYELDPIVSGLWSLNPSTGDLKLLNHAPSGDFSPIIDSYGRIVFTQWDHLQRDQEADADAEYDNPGSTDCSDSHYGTFNYQSEESTNYSLNNRTEIFPEPRKCRTDLLNGTNLSGHTFNHFFPWTINQDGTDGETLAHLGRQEFGLYIEKSITDDSNIIDFYRQYGGITNQSRIHTGTFQIKEDPNQPGDYYAVDAPEFGTHASGKIVRINAPIGQNADTVTIDYITHPDTYNTSSSANHSGRYRDPLILLNGTLLAVYSPFIEEDEGSGLDSDYTFRIASLKLGTNGYHIPDTYLTSGISKTISYWDPDVLVSYSGIMWELNPVEVRPRTRPAASTTDLPAPEQQIFSQTGVDLSELTAWMEENGLALIVGRDITTRDDIDKQQPFNLRVPNGIQTSGAAGKIYDVSFLQLFQADQIRGLTGCCDNQPEAGRRVLAQIMHDSAAVTANPITNGPAGTTTLAEDGSFAVFVPAQRAMTWQLTNQNGAAVVRERYWLTFQPGEVRVCTSCHGINTLDQSGSPAPTNPPEALRDLLEYWKIASNSSFADVSGFHWTSNYIESIYNAGITGGCNTSPLMYCPDSTVTRAQMAVFLLRGIHGSSYTPPTATGAIFNDAAIDSFAAAWIEQFVAEGITAGCGNNNYCPNTSVTRAQMAVFLLRAKHGSGYTPPLATGTVFTDIPLDSFGAAWIEQLVAEGITGGCGGGNYCPNTSVTRAQMAVFLQRTFNLELP